LLDIAIMQNTLAKLRERGRNPRQRIKY